MYSAWDTVDSFGGLSSSYKTVDNFIETSYWWKIFPNYENRGTLKKPRDD